MRGTDKFLLGIVVGVIVLVGVAFALVLLRPEPVYQEADSPEAAAHNYLLALQKLDYARAYDYLSPRLIGYPASLDEFVGDIQAHPWKLRRLDDPAALSVESVQRTGDRAVVFMRETRFRQRGLFDSAQYTNTFEMMLQRDGGGWRLVSSELHWLPCWEDRGGCR
jgi:hypothetical protein